MNPKFPALLFLFCLISINCNSNFLRIIEQQQIQLQKEKEILEEKFSQLVIEGRLERESFYRMVNEFNSIIKELEIELAKEKYFSRSIKRDLEVLEDRVKNFEDFVLDLTKNFNNGKSKSAPISTEEKRELSVRGGGIINGLGVFKTRFDKEFSDDKEVAIWWNDSLNREWKRIFTSITNHSLNIYKIKKYSYILNDSEKKAIFLSTKFNLIGNSLSEAQKLTDLNGLSELTYLHSINVKNNSITTLAPLRNLVNLKVLNVIGNNINSLNGLERLTNLEYLHAGSNFKLNNLEGIIRLLDNSNSKLKEIQIPKNPILITNHQLQNLQNHKKIKNRQVGLLLLKSKA